MEQSNVEEWYGSGSTKYDASIHPSLLVEIFERGEGVAAFCKSANISDKTFQAWVDKHSEFKSSYGLAIEKGRAEWERKYIELSQQGISFNHNFFMTIYRNRYKFRSNKWISEKGSTTKERLEASWDALIEGKITSQEYNQIASGLSAESRITELEIQREAVNNTKNNAIINPELEDDAIRAYMLVKAKKGKIVEIDTKE